MHYSYFSSIQIFTYSSYYRFIDYIRIFIFPKRGVELSRMIHSI